MFLSENFMFLEVKFSIYLNRRVFVMKGANSFFKREDPFRNGEKNNSFNKVRLGFEGVSIPLNMIFSRPIY